MAVTNSDGEVVVDVWTSALDANTECMALAGRVMALTRDCGGWRKTRVSSSSSSSSMRIRVVTRAK